MPVPICPFSSGLFLSADDRGRDCFLQVAALVAIRPALTESAPARVIVPQRIVEHIGVAVQRCARIGSAQPLNQVAYPIISCLTPL